jgi:hypothetical protein
VLLKSGVMVDRIPPLEPVFQGFTLRQKPLLLFVSATGALRAGRIDREDHQNRVSGAVPEHTCIV